MGAGGAVVGDVLHGKTAATDTVNGDGLFQHTQFFQHFTDQFEYGAMHTAGAEAHHHIITDALRSRVYLFHHAPSLSRMAFAAATTWSRLMISPPLRRQVWMGQRSFTASVTSSTNWAGMDISTSSTAFTLL